MSIKQLKEQIEAFSGALNHMSRSEVESLLTKALTMVDIPKYQKNTAQLLMSETEIVDLVPDRYSDFRQIVSDGVLFLLSQFSEERFISLLVDQLLLNEGCPSEMRLVELVKKIPTLHKLGQIIARNQEIDKRFRKWLISLENDLHGTDYQFLREKIQATLGQTIIDLEIKLDDAVLSEASVGAVIAFSWKKPITDTRARGVFKLLKPFIRQHLNEELGLLDELALFYDANRERYALKDFRFIETFKDVSEALKKEINLTGEQENLKRVASFYEKDESINIPHLLPFSSPDFTAMEFIEGAKVTDIKLDKEEKKKCARTVFQALVVSPLFSFEQWTPFHGDPHGGNIFAQRERDGNKVKVSLFDWSQAGKLSRQQRYGFIQLLIGIILEKEEHLYRTVQELSLDNFNELAGMASKLRYIIHQVLNDKEISCCQYIERTLLLVDRIALGGVRFPRDLLLFRKAIFTLKGVLHDLDPTLSMDSYMIDALGNILMEEMPKRGINMMFPLLDTNEQYRTLLTNLDLISLWSQLFLRMLQKGIHIQNELTSFNFERMLKMLFFYLPEETKEKRRQNISHYFYTEDRISL